MHILVVGSSVIDLFLSIDRDHVETHDNKVAFNLGDKVPVQIKRLALGGNGANVSVGLTRLEIPTTFYTYLGSDILSREIEEGLTSEGVSLAVGRGNIQNAPLHIILGFDSDRVILSHYEKTNHDFDYQGSEKFDFIFLNSIADYWEEAYRKTYDYASRGNIPFAFSPGSRQLDNLNDLIYNVIKKTKIFFSNKEEAQAILKTEESDAEKLLLGMKKLGPEIVSITDGPRGAYAIDSKDNCFFMDPLPSDSTEKTGAGDSYATAFFASYLHGNDIPKSMLWGGINAQAVMDEVGAQAGLLTKKVLDEKVRELNNLKAIVI